MNFMEYFNNPMVRAGMMTLSDPGTTFAKSMMASQDFANKNSLFDLQRAKYQAELAKMKADQEEAERQRKQRAQDMQMLNGGLLNMPDMTTPAPAGPGLLSAPESLEQASMQAGLLSTPDQMNAALMRQFPKVAEQQMMNRFAPDPVEPMGYGKSPIYMNGPNGLAVGVLGDDGQLHLANGPQGYQPVRPSTFTNLGGEVAVTPFGSTTPTAMIPKTLPPEQTPEVKRRQAAATEYGKNDATTRIALPQTVATAKELLANIEALKNHPGLEYAVGKTSLLPVIPGSKPADFMARLDQIKGGVFLEAYKQLRGGGQITEVEGKKAEQALARLERSQTEEGFKQALDDFYSAVAAGLRRAESQASNAPTVYDQADAVIGGM